MSTVGIVREWKTASERRSPLTPDDVKRLRGEGLEFVVEPSPHRVFGDEEWIAVGARVQKDLSECDFLLGIKEMEPERLYPGKPHLFFSHTLKGQPVNMGLLARFLELPATLLDYELVVDERGKRMIFFGFQAGQAGMVNTLWTCGQRWKALGVDTPLATLKQALAYRGLDEARTDLDALSESLRQRALPDELGPLVVGVTGRGNVAKGALDILAHLRPATITADDLLARRFPAGEPVLLVHFEEAELYERIDGGGFQKPEYREQPELYRSRFEPCLRALSCLVVGNYWEPRYPRLATRDELHRVLAAEDNRLVAIGDVSCDIEGSIEVMSRSTYPEDPVYVYDPRSEELRDGFEGEGIAIMAVDILPSEIPRESSISFGSLLSPYLKQLASCDWSRPFEELDLPAPFRPAVIAHRGELTEPFAWLETCLPTP